MTDPKASAIFLCFCTGPFLTAEKRAPKFSADGQICAMEITMATILPFIRSETAFDDATTRVMGLAFDAACTEFQNTNLTNFAREILAERIIQAAKLGERDPRSLCRIAVAAL